MHLELLGPWGQIWRPVSWIWRAASQTRPCSTTSYSKRSIGSQTAEPQSKRPNGSKVLPRAVFCDFVPLFCCRKLLFGASKVVLRAVFCDCVTCSCRREWSFDASKVLPRAVFCDFVPCSCRRELSFDACGARSGARFSGFGGLPRRLGPAVQLLIQNRAFGASGLLGPDLEFGFLDLAGCLADCAL